MLKHLSIFSWILLLFMGGVVFSPKPPDHLQQSRCFANIEIKKFAILTINCDSPEFMNLVVSPHRIFEVNNERQSRPGLSFIAYLFTPFLKPLEKLVDIFQPHARRNEHGRANLHPKEDLIAYSALILANVLMILLAYIFYQASLNPTKSFNEGKIAPSAFLISLMLIANMMNKLFILTPHTQLLNLTAPLLSIWIAYRTYYMPTFGTRMGYLISFILGLSMLVYSIFICPFVVLISIAVFLHFQKYKFSKWRFFIRHFIVKGFLFVLPSLAWYLTVLHITGSYYVPEIDQYNYGMWIKDSFLSEGILGVFGAYLHSMALMLKISFEDFIPTLLLFSAAFIWAFPEIKNSREFCKALTERILLSLWVEFMFLGFFSTMGYYPPRLCYSLIPVWWPVIGYIANHVYQRKTYLFNPKIFSLGIGVSLFFYSIWILSTPWDFRLW